MKNVKEVKMLNTITHSVRRSQAVLQYGVGAMIDFPSQVLMTALPEEWRGTEDIHDERLEKLLGVNKFISPSESGISFVRFPRWYFCPKCRAFKPIEKWQKEYLQKVKRKGCYDDIYMIDILRCPDDNQELVPTRIVTVCEHGHIDDFPWVNWVHRKNYKFGKEKDVCTSPSLLFKTGSSATSGLEGVEIECKNCNAKASLLGAFSSTVFKELETTSKYHTQFCCQGRHPWKNVLEDCDKYPCAKQRGAASVYFPRIVSSLVIPPYSSLLTTKVEESATFKKIMNIVKDIDDCENQFELAQKINKKIDKYVEELAREIYEDVEAVRAVLKRKLIPTQEEPQVVDKELQYKSEEYKALTGKITSEKYERDEFRREGTDVSLYNIKGIKSIALIHKVKEVTALIGFSRINPTHSMDSSDGRFVSVKRKETDYYPATISRGEGIFLEFNKEELTKFFNATSFVERADSLNEKYGKSFYGSNNARQVDSEFLFIHTLAHLLIKELSFNCGYPTASIRERLYYGESDGENMCGVLIYTTGGDAEGTLGGLVRQGYSDCLPIIIKKALDRAKFCANDPVCSFSNGQGIEALNYAACHTCALLPETCCELSNILLDRTVVVGNMDGSIKGFFS
ncbi:MAG: DUF1998 domain-containing protein [Clostridia bacterium]|nr:DUF1998 domain-containing protein [Clostridia bacterium]